MERREPRAPYGRDRASGDERAPYGGESYYGRPAIRPGHWGWLIAGYYFVGGLAGGAQLLATIADLVDGRRYRSLVRAGRYLALAGALASPPLLIADLQTPARFANMLRIVRRTSPMSIGSWALAAFGATSGLAALAEVATDLTGTRGARRVARWTGLPAALAGALLASYTGALSTATSVPLWAAVPRILPSLFGASSLASASAALTLAQLAGESSPESLESLEQIALVADGAALALMVAAYRAWRLRGVAGPLAAPRFAAMGLGVAGLGAALPLALHLVARVTGKRHRAVLALAALATLAGIFAERALIVFAGNESARRPQDYLHFTQPR